MKPDNSLQFAGFALLAFIACANSAEQPSSTSASAMAEAQAAVNTPSGAPDAPHPGEAVYKKACAACHDNPEATRSPSLATLKAMRYQTLSYALTQGKMQAQAAALSASERAAVVDFLVGRERTSDEWIETAMCAPEKRTVDLKDAPSVAGFGFDLKNTRRLTAAQTKLTTADF